MSNEELENNHCRYYRIAGITIQVESDLPITDSTFRPEFRLFQVDGPDENAITIRHHFSLPSLDSWDMGKEAHREPPWAVYRMGDSWIYVGILPASDEIWKVAVCNRDHTRVEIYNPLEETFLRGGHCSLTTFPTDQVVLAQILADRKGCYLHSSGVNLDGKGLLFVGHSEAGKSTMVKMLKGKAEILCDDRVIVRQWPEGYKVHGTWSRGEIPEVSAGSAPLRAILFLEQARENLLIPLDDKKEVTRRLLACLVKPLVTADWWIKMLAFMEKMISEVSFYIVRFDKSGRVVDLLECL